MISTSRTNASRVKDDIITDTGMKHLLDRLVDPFGRPFEPTSVQVPLLNDRTRFQVWLMGRRCGKSTTAAVRAIIEAMKPYKRVWIVAPYYELTEKIYRIVHSYVTRCLPFMLERPAKYSQNGMSMKFINGSEIVCKSADKEDQLIGESLDLVIVDEAGVVKDKAIEFLTPGLNDINPLTGKPKGTLIAVSTPRKHNWFRRWWDLGRTIPEDQIAMFGSVVHSSHHADSYSNPHIDRISIEIDRKRLPESLWLQEYMAQWQNEGGLVFPIKDVHFYPSGFRTPKPGQVTYMGVDIARTMDYTVIAALNSRCEMLGYKRLNKTDWPVIKNAIREEIERFASLGRVIVCIDEGGVGSPIFSDIKNYFSTAGQVYAHPINYSRSVQEKRDIVEYLRMGIADGLLKFWDIDEIKKEFEEYEYQLDSKGQPSYGHPEGEGKHDDIVTAVGLAYWAQKLTPPSIDIIRTH